MKQISVERANLAACVTQAQRERLVITKKGKPVAVLVGVEGQDSEQLGLATSASFWKMIERRRKQKTLSRAQLERKVLKAR
jgi:prevent-host-death family protein